MPESRINLKKKRIRSFFFEQITKEDEVQEDILVTGLEYIQMRLPVEKITKEYEDKLKEKVERNILHAKIREATEADLESVMYVYNRSWMTSHEPYSPIDSDSLKKIFDYPETVILVARVYGTDGGFVILDYEGENMEHGIIAGLGVIPRYQRKGLGTVVGMAAWDFFKKNNVKELRCEVYKDNKVSYDFIKSLGFEEYGTKTYKSEDFHQEE